METKQTNNLSPLQHKWGSPQVGKWNVSGSGQAIKWGGVSGDPGQEDILRQAERLVPIYKKHTDKSEA